MIFTKTHAISAFPPAKENKNPKRFVIQLIYRNFATA